MDLIFAKTLKTSSLGHFLGLFGSSWPDGTFFQKLSLVTYDYLTSCEKLKNWWANSQIGRTDGRVEINSQETSYELEQRED